ncbi:GGDEF domain-containing protein [Actinoplanes sp. NPDC051346]|uniref:GGDEF domain-containing protein n=1 Tax=Actinoplanes sp. NPDC051346 TaxID=3155048 RepID=UPI00341BEF2D
MGWVTVVDSCIGLLYAVVFAGGQPHRLAIGLLAALGGVFAVGLILRSDRLSRAGSARQLMLTYAVVLVAMGGVLSALDGGASSVCALSLLLPMPLIALSTPARVAIPIITLSSAVYAAVAVWVGVSSGWYAVLFLAGAVAVSIACGEQGKAAARQRWRLTRVSRIDVLTDVLNRRGFEERFAAEAGRAGTVSLLIYDLDGFKQVNDLHGHAAGDELLCWVAATLSANVDRPDAVGRLGGDEFVVLLTSPDSADASAVAERLRDALAVRTAASMGLATLGPDGGDFDLLYARADAQLYAEKAGRGGYRRAAA